MIWLDHITRISPHLAAGFDLLAAVLASTHILLNKRDTRAATIWLSLVWILPLLGPIFYLAFGVNRIRRRALRLGVHETYSRPLPDNLDEPRHEGAEHLRDIARVVGQLTTRPLRTGNEIEPLVNGDMAFPAMLGEIDAATKSISLCSYIFDNDVSGRRFIAALQRAVKRGVAVRVLVDAAGARYSWPPITWNLRSAGLRYARFLPASIFTPWRVATINLRNHRKLLIVDGHTAFTGGINIRQGNMLLEAPKTPVQDLHFRIIGPVVGELQETFANDWAFTTREVLEGELWFPEQRSAGKVIARAVPDGPDGDFENTRWMLLAALAEAQTSVRILTPYFLPDATIITALNLAALRGVHVDIILPAKSNLPYVHWASRALWWQVLERGCHIWLTPPPFDHSKLMVVDGSWVMLGSANWDPRSLRLNFELNVECYNRDFAANLEKMVAEKIAMAHLVTRSEVDRRSTIAKLRDAVARLFTPFL